MAWLFGISLFFSALLLFLVQPMIAKMLLPLLGGVPAVWNTCLVFFQAMLLAGYAYAHWVTARLALGSQLVLHLGLLLLAALTLPLGLAEGQTRTLSAGSSPSLWLLWSLTTSVGLPFFIVSTTSPLLQRWFSRTRHASAHDPYFLYAASNCGSFLALIAYPALLEPHLRLRDQSVLWAVGYVVMAVLVLACGLVAQRNQLGSTDRTSPFGQPAQPATETASSVDGAFLWQSRLRWVVLAFVPSSLMLGVTNYLGTDIVSFPLLWVVPLALYLLTYILSFTRKRVLPIRWLARSVPIGALAVACLILSRATQPVLVLLLVHLAFFWLAGMLCHGQLADNRPGAERLTEFYLALSVGGVLGGAFNALVAPKIFTTAVEYPLAVVLACLLRPPASAGRRGDVGLMDFAFPVLLGTLTACLGVAAAWLGLNSIHVRIGLVIGIPAILGFVFVDRPVRFGLGLGAIFCAGWFSLGLYGKTLYAERNFFGVSRVTQSSGGTFRQFVHGDTLNGRQFIEAVRQCEPLTYYHRTGPIGDVFNLLDSRSASTNIAVIGLGTGSMSAYSRPDQSWTYYEVDPAVIRIAQDTNCFTFLKYCAQGALRLVAGDGRLRLREAAPGQYNLIVLDAFSSDAIPVHLLTREALDLYLSKLAEGGLLAFHISNRYLELEPVVGELAKAAQLVCRSCDESNLSGEDLAHGKEESHWVVLARRTSDLGRLAKTSRWLAVRGNARTGVWTDDFSNVLSVFKWK